MKTKGTSLVVRGSISLLLCGVVVFFGFQAFGEEWSTAQKDVWKMEESRWELWKKGDVEGRMALLHKDCSLWGLWYAFPKDKSSVKSATYQKIESFKLKPIEIKVFGNVAIVQYSTIFASPGKEYSALFSNTWMKQDGKWQIIGSMGASCTDLPYCIVSLPE